MSTGGSHKTPGVGDYTCSPYTPCLTRQLDALIQWTLDKAPLWNNPISTQNGSGNSTRWQLECPAHFIYAV